VTGLLDAGHIGKGHQYFDSLIPRIGDFSGAEAGMDV
jgi:hypothetical protein